MAQNHSNKYVSCDWVNNGLEFRRDSIRTCCYAYLQDLMETDSTIIEDYHGENLDWDSIIEIKNKQIELHKSGKVLPQCEGCIYLYEKEWNDDIFIDHITLNHWSKCNCDCTYCYAADDKIKFNTFKHYDFFPILKDMIERKILRATPRSCIIFGGGEPTILENFDETIMLLLNNGFRNIRINSSGIKYSKSIEEGLKLGAISLVISPDAGTKGTYEKIKQVKTFDKVWENIRKYVVNSNYSDKIKSKYIIIPGINDNTEELDAWFNKVLESGAKSVSASVEQAWYAKTAPYFSEDVYNMIKYIEKKAALLNLELELYIEALSLIKKYEENHK